MQRSGFAELPLHSGKAPRWLFHRMQKLTKEMCSIILDDFGSGELLRRLSDPLWFQGLACVLGYDWHSSGTTTTTCGALKMALNTITDTSSQVLVAGGKGHVSKQTPHELLKVNDQLHSDFSSEEIGLFIRASKLSAKVDNTVVQDSFQLYHHCFFVDSDGNYTVIQQGMNKRWARRYHWASDRYKGPVASFSEQPRDLIACDHIIENTLNLSAIESNNTRRCILDLICDNPSHLRRYFSNKKGNLPLDLFLKSTSDQLKKLNPVTMPARHHIIPMDLGESEFQTLLSAYEQQPRNFDEFIEIPGIGPKKLRALTLVSELIFGTTTSWKDPVKYSFAHGGKDGIPFPVDRQTYDFTIQTLRSAIDNAKLSHKDQLRALKNLSVFTLQRKTIPKKYQ